MFGRAAAAFPVFDATRARRSCIGNALSNLNPSGDPAMIHRLLAGSVWLPLLASLACMNARADADADLAKTKKCLGCHAVDEKRIGPPYKAVAAKYANDKDAEARLAKKIREGGSGVWGVLVMPPNDVSAAEARRLAHWVLERK